MNVRRIVILGNSGAARECYWLLQDVLQAQSDLRFKGFLSFEGFKGNLCELSDLEMGSDDNYPAEQEDLFVIGIGNPVVRGKAFLKWKGRGCQFMNLVHPTVRFVGSHSIGEANILAHGCHISCNTTIGSANYLNGSVVLGHDVRIGDNNFLAPFTQLLGGARVGSGNSFGVNTVALAGAKIGSNNTIAPGAYIYKGCGDNQFLAGNPAQRVDA